MGVGLAVGSRVTVGVAAAGVGIARLLQAVSRQAARIKKVILVRKRSLQKGMEVFYLKFPGVEKP